MTIELIKVSREKYDREVVKQVKNDNKGNVLVLFQDGGLYIAYDEDAKAIVAQCGLCSCTNENGETIKFCKDIESYVFARMVKVGYKLCVIE